MDEPRLPAELGDILNISVIRPPLSLKPKEDFLRLLSEYKLWIRQNQDMGYAAFLTATRKTTLTEDTPWDIRQAIRKTGEESSASIEDYTLKWHFILHLARQLEENQAEAEEMLNKVKKGKSPLDGALEDGVASKGMFDDLGSIKTGFVRDDHHLWQVFEAWLGLFGEYLRDVKQIVTFDSYVMRYITEIFKEVSPEKPDQASSRVVQLNLPDTSNLKCLPGVLNHKDHERHKLIAGLSGKTLILICPSGQ